MATFIRLDRFFVRADQIGCITYYGSDSNFYFTVENLYGKNLYTSGKFTSPDERGDVVMRLLNQIGANVLVADVPPTTPPAAIKSLQETGLL